MTGVATLDFALLDGAAGPSGTQYAFEVVICSSMSYDATKVVTSFGTAKKSVRALNVEPFFFDPEVPIEMNDIQPEREGERLVFPGVYPVGRPQVFKALVDDPGAYDLSDKFETRWTVTRTGSTSKATTITGDPSVCAFTNAFKQAGEYKIEVKIHDKDMNQSQWITGTPVYITVVNQPIINIEDIQDEIELDGESSTKRKVRVDLGVHQRQYFPSLRESFPQRMSLRHMTS